MQLTPASVAHAVRIPAGPGSLHGELTLPAGATGIVVFTHGAGRNDERSRHRYIAQALQRSGLGTLRFERRTEDAAWIATGRGREHIEPVADRLVHATAWLDDQSALRGLRVGYFGAGAGSAAALVAAGKLAHRASSVVVCGGRPAVGGPHLPRVTAPTLLIVGGADRALVAANESAYERLLCPKRLVVVPGATQWFRESGALDEAAALATDWFVRHLEAGVRA